ncbi:MAG: ATP-binding protein [Cryomorphaceae bacterium]|nr:ATP-binding protein [Cryomorphaceae bacterium]
MAFYRKQIKALLRWKSDRNRKPLVLHGARQVGKTTLVNMFSKHYEQFITLNLEKKKDADYFVKYKDVGVLLDALLLTNRLQPVDQKETLLFIDEIHECPEAISQLRYFYEEIPALHIIAAGSLLEHALAKVRSFPVGRVQYLYVFPMNFQEFLLAHNMDALVQQLEVIPIHQATLHLAMEWFHRYALVGGMPEVIKRHTEQEGISQLPTVYESIWASYQDDVSKYAKNATEEKVIRHLMKTAPLYMDARVTFQGFGKSNYRSREVGESFRALDDAKIIQLIYPGTSVEYPLTVDFRKSPRLQFLDTGLLNHALGIQADLLAIDDLSTSYKGALLPHLITQELISMQEASYQKPHFWVRQKKDAQAEVDLVYPFRGLIIPIEIKSGAVGKLRSLHQFMDAAPHPFAVRMYAGPFRLESHKTPKGTPFYLMNIPYCLTLYLEHYLTTFWK